MDKKLIIKDLMQKYKKLPVEVELNSWQHVKALRDELLTDTENYPWRQSFEALWKDVSYAQFDNETQCDRTDETSNTPVEALLSWWEYPRYPPPEVYVSIVQCFEIYFAARGLLSLEDIFFGPAKKGIGNYSARKAADEDFKRFLYFCHIEEVLDKKQKRKRKSNQELAELFLINNKSVLIIDDTKKDYEQADQVEAFLKRFQRWKRSKKQEGKRLL